MGQFQEEEEKAHLATIFIRTTNDKSLKFDNITWLGGAKRGNIIEAHRVESLIRAVDVMWLRSFNKNEGNLNSFEEINWRIEQNRVKFVRD